MTPEQINTAIAEACGISALDFYHSIDACAEFERTMTIDCLRAYVDVIYDGICTTSIAGSDEATAALIRATAPQRCEAFLRVRGLWREAK